MRRVAPPAHAQHQTQTTASSSCSSGLTSWDRAMSSLTHVAATSPPPRADVPPLLHREQPVRVILYGPGHKPLLVLLNPHTTLVDIGNILRNRGSPMPPAAEMWAGNRRVTRGPPLLAQHVSAGMTLQIRLPLLGGTWPGGASIRRATPVVRQSKDHPMSRGPTPPHGAASRNTQAPSAAEALLQPSNTDWRPLHEAPHGEPRNLLLVPTGGLIRCENGWGVTARCAFGRASPEITLRASFAVPPHMAGSLLNTCIACRSAIRRSDTLVVVSSPGSVASIRDAPLLHAVCPQLFPAMPSLSSDIRRHLCVFAGVGGSASGFEAAAPGTPCTAVDSDPVVLQIFRARLPHATTICAALEALAPGRRSGL